MSPNEVLQKHSHRQYLAWCVWLNSEWNRPNRTDQYLMQIALQVARVLAKHPDKINLSQFKLEFKEANSEKPTDPLAAKHRWQSLFGKGLKIRTVDKDGNILSET